MPENAGMSEKFWGRGWELAGKVLTLRSLTECMPSDNGRRTPETAEQQCLCETQGSVKVGNRRGQRRRHHIFLLSYFFHPKNL